MSRRTLRCRIFGCAPKWRWSPPHFTCRWREQPWEYRGEAS